MLPLKQPCLPLASCCDAGADTSAQPGSGLQPELRWVPCTPWPAAATAACRLLAVLQLPLNGTTPTRCRAAIEEFVQSNKVVAFIKGTKQFPQV